MPFTCDTCGRIYSNKRNLCRHIKEKHDDGLLHFKCSSPGCKSRFIRRSYLNKHLHLIHKMDEKEAKQLVSEAILEPEHTPERAPLNELCQYEDLSDDENNQKDNKVTANVSDTEFDNWLDECVKNSPKKCVDPHPVDTDSTNLANETGYNICDEPTLEDVYRRSEEELNANHENGDDAQPLEEETDDIPASNYDEDQPREEEEADDIPATNDDEGASEQVEYINVTLKTTTRYKHGVIDKVDRVVSLMYSDSFNPNNVDPMTVFQRVQEEFVNYVNEYNK